MKHIRIFGKKDGYTALPDDQPEIQLDQLDFPFDMAPWEVVQIMRKQNPDAVVTWNGFMF